MAQESIQIADKPTLDEVKEIVENFKFMNIIECSFDSDKITIDPVKLTDAPYDFYYGSAVVLNGEIHILGGYDSDVFRKHYKWDGSSWTSVSTLPYKFFHASAVLLNGEIHILGSVNTGDNTKHYKWDGSSWTEVSTLPYKFYDGSAVLLNGVIHIFGGNRPSCDKHYAYI